jgi:hypothetical protein
VIYPAPIPASDLIGDLSEAALLSALKLQMEGLASVFGTAPQQRPRVDLAQEERTEEAFDNVPV